jgi:cell surface protein SprA
LKFQMNLTVRDTRTIQRKLDAETVVTNGFVNFQFRPQISYNVSKRMSLSMYFDKMFNNPYVSNTYYRSTIAAGFQVRFSLSD